MTTTGARPITWHRRKHYPRCSYKAGSLCVVFGGDVIKASYFAHNEIVRC